MTKTEETEETEEEEWAWLEERPVFTTRGEKGGNVTRVPSGAVLEPLRFGFVLLVVGLAVGVGCAIAGGGFVRAGLSDGLGALSWWWLALAVPGAVLGVFCFAGVYVRGMELLMRGRPRSLFLLTGLFGGIAPGLAALAAWWGWRGSDIAHYPDLIGYPGWNHDQVQLAYMFGIAAAVIAGACLVTALMAARGARRARLDVTRILRLRATGTAYTGVITALPDPATWNQGGDVPIRYQDGTGEHMVMVRLNTYAHEIPVPGTRVSVFTDASGDLLVELDPDGPLEYHPDNRSYESDTSGGGS